MREVQGGLVRLSEPVVTFGAVTIMAAVLFVVGTLMELAALGAVWLDFRDAEGAREQRSEKKKSMMAPNKHIVDDWITTATNTRAWGIWLFAAGLFVQMVGNLLALS